MPEQSGLPKESSAKTLLLFLGGTSLLVSLVIYFIMGAVWKPMKDYISPNPVKIEHYPVSAEAETLLVQKLNSFFAGTLGDSLFLNEEELNHMLRLSPQVRSYHVQYRLKLNDSTFTLLSSMPVSAVRSHMASIISVLNFQGFINSELEAKIRLKPQKSELLIVRSSMNGKDAPFFLLGNKAVFDLGEYFSNPFSYRKGLLQLISLRLDRQGLLMVRKNK